MVKLRQFLEAIFINLLLFLTMNFSEAVLWKKQCTTKDKYKICYTEQEEICHPLNKSTGMKIDGFDSTAIIVTPFTPIAYGNKLCRFTIKVKHKEMGLFAVIQNMNFRQNNEGECIDYVQFRSKDTEQWSQKWCGTMNRQKSESEIPHHFFSEYDHQGKLETLIVISDEPIKPNELNISIVYTPTIRCSKVDRKNFRPVNNEVCIWKDYICDGYQNCAIEGCDDEKECVRNIENSGTGTKVTVGAVTTIFLSFILFVTCLWICKKHKKLCWSADCAGPVSDRAVTSADAERVPPAPTAPMLQTPVSSGVQDKDLPPSYDSLFPQQSNTAIL